MRNSLSWCCLVAFFFIVFPSGVGYGKAPHVVIHVLKGQGPGTISDLKFGRDLIATLQRHGFYNANEAGKPRPLERTCADEPCLTVHISRLAGGYRLDFRFDGSKRFARSVNVDVPPDESRFDVLEALALRLLLFVDGIPKAAFRPLKTRKSVSMKSFETKKKVTLHVPEPVPEPVEPPARQSPPESREPARPEPHLKRTVVEKVEKPTVPIAPAPDHESNGTADSGSALMENGAFRLGVGISYLTGFANDFNTLGIDMSIRGHWFDPLVLRLDVGLYPLGGLLREGVPVRYVLVPIDVMIGYGRDLRRWYLGAYGGLFITASWFRMDSGSPSPSSKVLFGFGLAAEAAYRLTPTISIGMFLRFSYVSNTVEVIASGQPDNQNRARGTDEEQNRARGPDGEQTDSFTQPQIMLTSGLGLNVRF